MTATAAGATACVYAKRIINELRKMDEDIASSGGEPEGFVRVGGLAYSRSRLLPEAITRTITRFPHVVVRTVEGPLSALLVAAHAGDLDAIICARPDPARRPAGPPRSPVPVIAGYEKAAEMTMVAASARYMGALRK